MDVSSTRPLGRSGLKVTIASLGGGGLGNFFRVIDDASAASVVDAAWGAGIRYYDTAPFYGRGRSERRLGAWLDHKSRDSFVLSTKVGRLMAPARGDLEEDGIFLDPSPFNSIYDYSYDGVMRSHEASLQRLGLDRIDILLVHDIGEMMHGDDAPGHLHALKTGGMKALEELRSAGAIAGYGLGVNEVAACLDCLDYGDPTAFLLAGRLTLLEQNGVKPLLAKCLERQVSLIVGGVFNSGILATGAVPGARYNYAEADEAALAQVRKLETVCAAHDVPLSHAALQFPLTHPAVASVLIGAGTVSSVDRSIAGLSTAIPDALWRDLADQGLVDAELAAAAAQHPG
ncbi:aldo/keto reductase [Stakelama tenebrarum]|uniref:Aldo/keto reductase n=1 Tax=Stakelama tenebrarum TaxID=2711215 RepID=A0A6G6Y7I3_9SPHN|nr:aldo/keto reductase [Sphingosinithalassobacter tenebrarum]QIG80757.1 aldo/keto reductase [Sphingosinithalassobacter tenebrarum]